MTERIEKFFERLTLHLLQYDWMEITLRTIYIVFCVALGTWIGS